MTAPDHETRVLQRVIVPDGTNPDVIALYVETHGGVGVAEDFAGASCSVPGAPSAVAFNASESDGVRRDVAGALPRRTARVRAGQRVSFATYFNAFPASYWRRWTRIEAITLRIVIAGEATIVVYRSSARGVNSPVETVAVLDDGPSTVELALTLSPFIDGGWYWFDIMAGPNGATMLEADWLADVERVAHGHVSLGITTYNRPDSVVKLLRSIGEAPDVLEIVDAVYLIDHGANRADEHPEFAAATKGLADRLHVIAQGNLGGSGGFSRAMDETLRGGDSKYILLLDDDVVLEPEGVLRAATFADLARHLTIVGGHMFSLHDRSVLNAMAETVAPYAWWWGPAPHTHRDHDFARQGLRDTPWLHRRSDADYNGWWMCLIPTRLVRELGLSLPVFIKWDDAEYGLRARAAGYPTVSLPGAAVWHVPWNDKNDAVDWQAYYHVRNRLLAALLHSPYERGGRVVAESMQIQTQHLLSMQYSTAALRLRALEDVIRGPEHLHGGLLTTLTDLRALRDRYTDAQAAADIEEFPAVRRRKPPVKGKQIGSPRSKLGLYAKAARGAIWQLTPPSDDAGSRPAMVLAHQDASWWTLSTADSVLVSAADGASAAWYQRDPHLFGALMIRSIAAHVKLYRQWPELRASYIAAVPELTSPRAWRDIFAASTDPADRQGPS